MFAKARPQRKRDSSSNSANASNTTPLVSPLQMNFDFDLTGGESFPSSPFTPVGESPPRPKTSHGLQSSTRESDWSNFPGSNLQPPMLPPIPRVSSQHNSSTSTNSTSTEFRAQEGEAISHAREDSNNIPTTSQKSNLKARLSFEHPMDLVPPLSRTSTPGDSQTALEDSSDSMPIMESSLFPPKQESSAASSPSALSMPAMSRQFIDSRDKPYSQPPQRPFLMQHNHSSPNLMRSSSPAANPRLPNPMFSSRRTWISPKPSLQDLSSGTTLSGSTAGPSTHASASSASPIITIGTPYQSTVDSFPLPQLVQTRPKTPGPTTTVGGVHIPTHHTSGLRNSSKPPEQPKKRGRFLKPLAILQRRRSNQDPETILEERSQRQAQAQALARQRDVVASGLNKPPPDFDPRIKGKVVHDFSAPRGKRNTFDEIDMEQGADAQTPSISPSGFPPRTASLAGRELIGENTQRRSVHTPVFMEHLAENPEAARRISSIQAENLENKDFLQRASKHSSNTTFSQESAVLPPFARRSQTLDPMQASFYLDDDSNRSSDPSSGRERDSTLGSISEVSPITAHSTYLMPEARDSRSPVSPSSPDNEFRPLSDSALSTTSPRPMSEISVSTPRESIIGPAPQLDYTPSQQRHAKSASEATARPYSIVLAPPAINTIAEGSVESSPIEPPGQQAPQLLARGVSIRQTTLSDQDRASAREDQSVVDSSLVESSAQDSTPERTPEPERVTSIQFKPSKGQPKPVEKRASAVGHSKRSSNLPKHHPSNASRFSFQYGTESAAQEQALEEKHRKMRSSEIAQSNPRGRSPSEPDEDDYFDEDAMDDMDEMEMQQAAHELHPPPAQLDVSSQSSMYLQQAREMLKQPDSDEDSIYEEEVPYTTNENDVPHLSHPAFRTHSALSSHSRPDSYHDGYWRGSTIDRYMRDSCYVANHSRMPSQASDLNVDGSPPLVQTASPLHEHPGIHNALAGTVQPSIPQPLPSSFQHASSPSAGKPALPHRDSGSSERNRAVSGIAFGTPRAAPGTGHAPQLISPEAQRVASGNDSTKDINDDAHMEVTTLALPRTDHAQARPPRVSSLSSPPVGDSRDAGSLQSASGDLNLLAGFDFADRPTPLSYATIVDASDSDREPIASRSQSLGGVSTVATSSPQLNQHLRGGGLPSPRSPPGVISPLVAASGPSSLSQAVHSHHATSSADWGAFQMQGASIVGSPSPPATISSSNRTTSHFSNPMMANHISPQDPRVLTPAEEPPNVKTSASHDPSNDNDDMYFDDGNFDQDINDLHSGGIDEDKFDDDNFLARPGMLKGINHRRDRSSAAFTTASLGSDGPYPTFAMPNAARASMRYSQMMLEDLPLQAPVDPKYIPQRNPSEDMKRLASSDRVPPVPVPAHDKEAYQQMQNSLESYHAALADAANKAAAEGRFLRAPSVSTVRSPSLSAKPGELRLLPDADRQSINDDRSMYSNEQDGGEIAMPYLDTNRLSHLDPDLGRSNSGVSHLTHLTTYSPSKMGFDFGFDQPTDDDEDDSENDDDLVAAANQDVLASDEEGFYGHEFEFYGRPRANSGDLEAVNGGYFGPDGDDGLARNRSLKEPNLTPITERSEFSTRNSFIGLGLSSHFGPMSAGLYGAPSPAMARMPVTPLIDGEINAFDELRKLRANAFGGDSGSLRSSSNRSSSHSLQSALSPTLNPRPGQGYFSGSAPMQAQYSTDSSGSSNPTSAHPMLAPGGHQDSPHSAASNRSMPFSPADPDATPKKNSHVPEPTTARKVPLAPAPAMQNFVAASSSSGGGGSSSGNGGGGKGHSRSGSGADSVTYVQEPDPDGGGKPRWVLERRRTSEQGQLELIGRELVQGGWI